MTIPVPSKSSNALQKSTVHLARVLHNREGKYSLPERFRALFTLRALDTDEAVDIIGAAFEDPSALLKHELAYVLGQMRRTHANTILRSVLEDKRQETIVRHEAAEALGAIGSPESVEILEYYSQDEAVAVRETCEIALSLIRDQSKGESDGAGQNRSMASANDLVFGSVDPAPAERVRKSIAQLEEQLLDTTLDLYHRYKAMFALRNRGSEEAVLALCRGFTDHSSLFRHEIAYVLGQLQHPSSVPALTAVLRNRQEIGMVRHEAAEALGSIATPECLAILGEFEKDPEDVVRESCLVARDMYEYETSGELYFYPVEEVAQQVDH